MKPFIQRFSKFSYLYIPNIFPISPPPSLLSRLAGCQATELKCDSKLKMPFCGNLKDAVKGGIARAQ